MSGTPIVIVGAGHAGGTAAALLRQQGWTGGIVLVGDEPEPPYQRPPLSKAWLKGETNAETLALRAAEFYAANGIDLRVNVRATRLDTDTRTIALSTGETLSYHRAILATGSLLRRLPIPGLDLGSVLELRTIADAEKLKAALAPGKRLAVVGGGYVGLEVAASARALGCTVTVLEREGRLLARVASPALSSFYADTHRAKGADIRLGAMVAALEGEGGQVRTVRLADGTAIPCDVAVVGVGALANDALAREAGLACNDGIVVDIHAVTSDPAVYAIGDCTRRPMPLYGREVRLESVPNALEQARQAASHICGKPDPAPEVPWFWSDQYDVKLQMAGMPFDVDRVVVRGNPAAGRFAVFHLAATGAIQAVEAVNAPAEFMAGRLLIGKRTPVDAEKLADPAVPMKSLTA